jgi:23S rRNA pseudouridine1911/1915/1917 synthase
MVCKNDFSHKIIADQLKEHTIVRKYRALVHGNFKDLEGTIDKAIGRHPNDRKKMSVIAKNNKRAVTHYKVLETFPGYSYIECQLETGRTHQIRVHMASIGHPLVGDEVYGIKEKRNFNTNGQTLHAMILGFKHPRNDEYIETISKLPDYFEKILEILRK